MDRMKFIYWEMASHDTIDFKKVYVDMADDLIAGLLLSQIVYWHLPSKETGQPKLKVEKEGELWIAKGREDWHDEIRITCRQYDRAIKILENKDLVVVKTFKFDGNPMKHVRLNWNHFLAFLEYQLEENARKISGEPYSPMVFTESVKTNSHKVLKPTYTKGKKEVTQSVNSLTESTHIDYLSENTNKDKDINLVNKESLVNIINENYSTFASGRWSKKQWQTITNLLSEELLDEDGYFTKASDPYSYVKGCLKKIAHQHDMKTGKKEFTYKGTLIPFYNWLNE